MYDPLVLIQVCGIPIQLSISHIVVTGQGMPDDALRGKVVVESRSY